MVQSSVVVKLLLHTWMADCKVYFFGRFVGASCLVLLLNCVAARVMLIKPMLVSSVDNVCECVRQLKLIALF